MSAVLAEIDRMTISDKMLAIEHILRSVRMMPSESLSENKDERFGRKRPNVADYIGYCQKFNHETRSTDEIMRSFVDALTIAPITYVELAPQFLGNVERQNEFLRDLWIECDFGGSMDSVLAAHHAWYEHVLRKRKGEVVKRPIADVMIGAYALSKGGLITRNEDDFRSLYPTLKIFNPAAGGEAAQ